jgi:hypothetical protein
VYASNDTVDGIPSFGSQIIVAIGAGGLGNNSWEGNGRFFLEKRYEKDSGEDFARIYYNYVGNPYGFKFIQNKV